MKRFACGDVVPGCTATWELATDDEILAAVVEHAASEHAMVEVPDEVARAVRAKITTI